MKKGVLLVFLLMFSLSFVLGGPCDFSTTDCYDAGQDPIPICTCLDLNKTRLLPTRDYILKNNIDCSMTPTWPLPGLFDSGWDPIPSFTGELDGDGHYIQGLKVNYQGEFIGFIKRLRSSGVIKNIGFNNTDVKGLNYVGTIAGIMEDNAVIENTYVRGYVSGSGLLASDNRNIGGFVGTMEDNSFIHDSYSLIDNAGLQNVGGVAGNMSGGLITNSYTRHWGLGPVWHSIGRNIGTSNVGGIVGRLYFGQIRNVFSVANVSSKDAIIGLSEADYIGPVYWTNENPLFANTCVGSGISTSCIAHPLLTDFFDYSNAPISTWDFTYYWDNTNDGSALPKLKWEPTCTLTGSPPSSFSCEIIQAGTPYDTNPHIVTNDLGYSFFTYEDSLNAYYCNDISGSISCSVISGLRGVSDIAIKIGRDADTTSSSSKLHGVLKNATGFFYFTLDATVPADTVSSFYSVKNVNSPISFFNTNSNLVIELGPYSGMVFPAPEYSIYLAGKSLIGDYLGIMKDLSGGSSSSMTGIIEGVHNMKIDSAGNLHILSSKTSGTNVRYCHGPYFGSVNTLTCTDVFSDALGDIDMTIDTDDNVHFTRRERPGDHNGHYANDVSGSWTHYYTSGNEIHEAFPIDSGPSDVVHLLFDSDATQRFHYCRVVNGDFAGASCETILNHQGNPELMDIASGPLGSVRTLINPYAPVAGIFYCTNGPALPPLTFTPECSDGVDNADPEDTLADFPADPGCSSANDDDETDTMRVEWKLSYLSNPGNACSNFRVNEVYIHDGSNEYIVNKSTTNYFTTNANLNVMNINDSLPNVLLNSPLFKIKGPDFSAFIFGYDGTAKSYDLVSDSDFSPGLDVYEANYSFVHGGNHLLCRYSFRYAISSNPPLPKCNNGLDDDGDLKRDFNPVEYNFYDDFSIDPDFNPEWTVTKDWSGHPNCGASCVVPQADGSVLLTNGNNQFVTLRKDDVSLNNFRLWNASFKYRSVSTDGCADALSFAFWPYDLEFDEVYNAASEGDPAPGQIMAFRNTFAADKSLSHEVWTNFGICDTGWIEVNLTYNADTNIMTATAVSGAQTKVITHTISGFFGPFGFASTSGGDYSRHYIDNFSLTGVYFTDPGCADPTDLTEDDAATECNNGLDDDGDTKTDFCDGSNAATCDPGCASALDDDEHSAQECDDGIDNADPEDILADWPTDPGCVDLLDNDETDVVTTNRYFADKNTGIPYLSGTSVPAGTDVLIVASELPLYKIFQNSPTSFPSWDTDKNYWTAGANEYGEISYGAGFNFSTSAGYSGNNITVVPAGADQPINLIFNVNCSDEFDLINPFEFNLTVNDPDNFVVGNMTISDGSVYYFDTSKDETHEHGGKKASAGIEFLWDHTFNSAGSQKILITAENHREKLERFVNVIVYNSSNLTKQYYVASCIDKPEYGKLHPSTNITFNASGTKAISFVGNGAGGGTRVSLDIDKLWFEWTFRYSDGTESYCLGYGENFCKSGSSALYNMYHFNKIFPTVNENYAYLTVTIPPELIT